MKKPAQPGRRSVVKHVKSASSGRKTRPRIRPRAARKKQAISREAIAGAVKDKGLTDRQAEVLTHIAADESHRQIAQRLGVTESTADKHVEHLFERFGVHSRLELIYALLAYEDAPRSGGGA